MPFQDIEPVFVLASAPLLLAERVDMITDTQTQPFEPPRPASGFGESHNNTETTIEKSTFINVELRDARLEKTNTNNTQYYARTLNRHYSPNPHRLFELASRSLRTDLRTPVSHHHDTGLQTSVQVCEAIGDDRTSGDSHPIADEDALGDDEEFLLYEDQGEALRYD